MFWWFRWVLRLSLVGFIPTTPAQWHQADRQESSQQLPFHPASAGRLWQQGWQQDAAHRHASRMLRAVTLGPPSVTKAARHLASSQLWTQIFLRGWVFDNKKMRTWPSKREVFDYNRHITVVLYEYWSFVCKVNNFKPANFPGSGSFGSLLELIVFKTWLPKHVDDPSWSMEAKPTRFTSSWSCFHVVYSGFLASFVSGKWQTLRCVY